MERSGFTDVFKNFLNAAALREKIFTDSPGAKEFSVVIDLDF